MGSTSNMGASMPIAIVGLSCKFAGNASSPEKLWEMLAEGSSAWSEIPSSRFNVKGTHHPNHERINAVSRILTYLHCVLRQ
jgi:acyl transferase domain-containing protein